MLSTWFLAHQADKPILGYGGFVDIIREAQLADFQESVRYIKKTYPDLIDEDVFNKAWEMMKRIYHYLTIKDKEFFLHYGWR